MSATYFHDPMFWLMVVAPGISCLMFVVIVAWLCHE